MGRIPARSAPRMALLVFPLVMTIAVPGTPVLAEASVVRDAHFYIPISDGTSLSATLFRPGAPGRFPTILVYGAFGQGESAEPGGRGAANLGPQIPDGLVERGYNVLGVSIRGTGCSSGVNDPLSHREARDAYEVIEWIARQPWSTPDVGMTGESYLGMVEIFAAAQRPPHLEAIVPYVFPGDIYRDAIYPGGILADFTTAFIPAILADERDGVASGDARCLENQRDRPYMLQYNWASPTLALRAFDEEMYRARSLVSASASIRIPVLMGLGWQDMRTQHGLDTFKVIQAPKRALLTNGDHADPQRIPTFQQETIAWFDRWLKGIRNGADNKPLVTVFHESDESLTPNFVRSYETWPPGDVAYQQLYLRAGGTLSSMPPPSGEAPDSYAYPGGADRNPVSRPGPAVGGLTYSSEPFEQATLVAGHLGITLFVSSTATDTDVWATLSEMDGRGNVTFVQRASLRASRRAMDPDRSTFARPYHYHTASAPLEPAKVYRLDLESFDVSHLFRQGSRVRLDIAAPPAQEYALIPTPAVNGVHHSPDFPSRVLLPVTTSGGTFPPGRPCGTLLGQTCLPVAVNRQ
jgi:putative CocE/NonD family hydrolase